MKVLQVMPHFGIGGAEMMCETLIYQLKKRNVENVVISLYDYHSAITERLEQAGIRIYYLHKRVGPDFSLFSKIRKILETEKPDVVHTHRNALQYAFPAAKKMQIRFVHTLHSVADKENIGPTRWLHGRMFKKHNVIPVALSDQVQDTIASSYRMEKEKIPIILNGVNLEGCLPKETYAASDRFTIINVARFSAPKNHACLIRAFRMFHDRHENSLLWLVGDGEKRPEIEKMVSENCLTDSVIFWGVQNNVFSFLHQADIFTLPSSYEGIPMSLIEAMGTGLPIVATAVGGIPDMIEDGKNGLLCKPDPDEISQAFEKCYLNQEMRETLGRNALTRANDFSAGKMADKYLEIYSG